MNSLLPGKYRAVVFDLDGTLLDTLGDLAGSLNQALAEAGLPPHAKEEYRFMVGHGLETLVARALPEALRTPARARPISRRFSEIYRTRQCETTRPYDGISGMLAELARLGARLALLSNKAHPNTLEMAEHFFPGLFQVVLGLRPEVPPKPDPAGALEIARKFALSPSCFVYLGDSGVDMKTATAAGMFPVGAAWGYRPARELREAGAEKILRFPAELVDLFR
ncbi:MAG: HAD family hydrolase [Candidatus Adiutrix sp.]|jgi:phosphoglycolate phosphatase|nr:HAD family hydrolase [Candidatus Adiutrix sp.]